MELEKNVLLFFDNQDTESEQFEMRISQPIFTHKKYQRLHGKIISIL